MVLGVLACFADQRKDGPFDRRAGDVAVRRRSVADDDRSSFDDGTADRGCGISDLALDSGDRIVFGEQADLGRARLAFDRVLEPVGDGVGVLAVEHVERLGFDLQVAVVAFDLAL